MQEKYRFKEQEAEWFSDFVSKMLDVDPRQRANACDLIESDWLVQRENSDNFRVSDYEYQLQQTKKQLMADQGKNSSLINYVDSENDDADLEDNDAEERGETGEGSPEGSETSLNPMNAERSFLNCGYLGYKNGIKLEELDNTKNWQFS